VGGGGEVGGDVFKGGEGVIIERGGGGASKNHLVLDLQVMTSTENGWKLTAWEQRQVYFSKGVVHILLKV
jgi:hypothetical protein